MPRSSVFPSRAGPARRLLPRAPREPPPRVYAPPLRAPRARAMAIDRRRDAAGGGPGRQLPPTEENGSLPPGDAAASAPLGGRAGSGGGSGEIQPLPALPPGGGGGPHPGCCSAAAAPSLLLLDYDGSVLPFLGGLGGGYQRTLVLLTWIPALFIGFTQFSDSFLLDQPNFWCRGAGKGSELAGTTLGGPWGEPGNWTSPAPTPFSATAWGATRNASGHGGAEEGDTPPLPSPPDKGDNASNCDCRAWDYGIRTGLVQNVVSKVRPPCRCPCPLAAVPFPVPAAQAPGVARSVETLQPPSQGCSCVRTGGPRVSGATWGVRRTFYRSPR